ncbi:MAG: PAS domain S-box protein, partial [Nitrospirales bacterium]|nr:PAS domain S-box protein [Nitrospirales bacterium]
MFRNLHQDILESILDAVYVVDTNRKITFWNKGAELLTGYSLAQVKG